MWDLRVPHPHNWLTKPIPLWFFLYACIDDKPHNDYTSIGRLYQTVLLYPPSNHTMTGQEANP